MSSINACFGPGPLIGLVARVSRRREYVSNTTLLFTVLIVGNNVMMIMEQLSEIRNNKLDVAVGGASQILPFVKIKRTEI